MSSLKKCFVIMPFSATKSHSENYWKKHFELFLKPKIEKVEQIRVYRSEPLRGSVANQIILNLITSDIVVADLTDHNPNVFWELGVRQSFKHCTITIAESNTSIPFHLSHKGILFYDPNHLDDTDFNDQFIAAIKDCLFNPESPDSPVVEAITGRGTLFEIFRIDETIRRVNALIIENNKNKEILTCIYTTIDENQKITDLSLKNCITSKLQDFATQLLVTNRYLDKDNSFYRFFVDLLDDIGKINTELDQWQRSFGPAEKWFSENKTKIENHFTISANILSSVYEELRKRSTFTGSGAGT